MPYTDPAGGPFAVGYVLSKADMDISVNRPFCYTTTLQRARRTPARTWVGDMDTPLQDRIGAPLFQFLYSQDSTCGVLDATPPSFYRNIVMTNAPKGACAARAADPLALLFPKDRPGRGRSFWPRPPRTTG